MSSTARPVSTRSSSAAKMSFQHLEHTPVVKDTQRSEYTTVTSRGKMVRRSVPLPTGCCDSGKRAKRSFHTFILSLPQQAPFGSISSPDTFSLRWIDRLNGGNSWSKKHKFEQKMKNETDTPSLFVDSGPKFLKSWDAENWSPVGRKIDERIISREQLRNTP